MNRQVRQERQGVEEIGAETARFSIFLAFHSLALLAVLYDFAACLGWKPEGLQCLTQRRKDAEEGGLEILYWDRRGLGNVRLFSRSEFQERFAPDRLGPDALEITAEDYCNQLGRSQREIKPALLDQRAVAGIGNLYASEILHVAGIHPQRRCSAMTAPQWQTLTAATQKVLVEAVRYEGSTLGDGTYRNALNQQGGYQNKHQVYSRAGES